MMFHRVVETYRACGTAVCIIAVTGVLLLHGCDTSGKNQGGLEKAKAAFAKGDFAATTINLKNILSENPDSAEARYLLGLVILESGDSSGAEIELRRALKLGYSADFVAGPLARAMLNLGKHQAVVKEFESAEPADVERWAQVKTAVADALAMGKATDRALELVQKVLERSPRHVPAILSRARLEFGQQGVTAALADVERALGVDPASRDALRLKGDIFLFGARDKERAIQAYSELVKVAPTRIDSNSALISAFLVAERVDDAEKQLSVLRKMVPDHIQVRFFDAQIALMRGQYEKARDGAQSLAKLAGDNPRLLQLLGAAELRLGNYVRAEAALARAVFLQPDQISAKRLLAEVAIKSGQPKRALDILQVVLQSPDADADSLGLAAESHMLLGQFDRAERLFAKALERRPDDTRTKTAMALVDLSRGQAEKAFGALDAIASNAPDNQADLALVSALLSRRQFDRAMVALERIEKRTPGKAQTSVLRAQVYQAKGERAAVRKAFEEALQRDARYATAVIGLAMMDVVEVKPDDARKRLEAFLSANPTTDQAWLALAGIASRASDSRTSVRDVLERGVAAAPNSAELRVLLVDHHLKYRASRAALTVAQAAQVAFPNRNDVADALGRALFAGGELNQALKVYSTLAARDTTAHAPLLRMTELYLASGDKDQAWASIRRAYSLAPDAVEVMSALIGLANATQRFESATDAVRDLKKRYPDEALPVVIEADLLSAQKNAAGAEALYRAAAGKRNPSLAAIRLHALLVAQKREAEAERFARDWRSKRPKDVAFIKHQGEVALFKSNYQDAAVHYSAALALVPDDVEVLNNLAWARLQGGLPDALPLAQRAMQLRPDQFSVMGTYAHALLAAGRAADAAAIWKSLIDLEPQKLQHRLNLARAAAKSGNKELALAQLDELAKRGSAFKQQAEVDALRQTLK